MLEFVKVGEPVALYTGRTNSVYVKVVERITPGGQVILKDHPVRFRRSTGRQIGDHYFSTELRAVTDPAVIEARALSVLENAHHANDRILRTLPGYSVEGTRTALAKMAATIANAQARIDAIERGEA